METRKVIEEMLKENTGTHFLDSGNAYGRNWQQNQDRDFDKEMPTTLSFKYGSIELTHNVYHWLCERLAYNGELDTRFQAFADREENADKFYLELMQEFVENIDDASGIYGDGRPITVNTYNGEDLLSQIIQYIYWNDSEGVHVLLQIHGGCDVRGGYTRPRAFDVDDYDGTAIFNNADGTIQCDACDKYWSTDDGYNFYEDGSCGRNYEKLNELPILESSFDLIKAARKEAEVMIEEGKTQTDMFNEDEEVMLSNIAKRAMCRGDTLPDVDKDFWRMVAFFIKPGDLLVVDKESGDGVCPVCGNGTLHGCYM